MRGMETEEAEIIDLFELHYSDLSSSPSTKIDSIMEALGATGPGLLAITGVPNASNLRSYLLPLARKLALLDHETRKRTIKEHNLGSDVPLRNPDRSVSSFAAQLKYAKSHFERTSDDDSGMGFDSLENLGSAFRELGFCMMELGLCLARVCDKAIGGNELEQSLLESCAAKGRLIHYHSHLDAILLKQHERNKTSSKKGAKSIKFKPLQGSECSNSIANDANLWQQWHYDYGIFTVLTAPLILMPTSNAEDSLCCDECPSPLGHSCLQIYDPNKKKVFRVRSPPESFIVQVGESADIISKGKLRSTLHSVHRPSKFENLSRETFVVFLQPAWTKTFSVLDYPRRLVASDDGEQSGKDDDELSHEILKIVPPLSSRLRDGMTFAEFSRETTKQYYGGSGLQSNR